MIGCRQKRADAVPGGQLAVQQHGIRCLPGEMRDCRRNIGRTFHAVCRSEHLLEIIRTIGIAFDDQNQGTFSAVRHRIGCLPLIDCRRRRAPLPLACGVAPHGGRLVSPIAFARHLDLRCHLNLDADQPFPRLRAVWGGRPPAVMSRSRDPQCPYPFRLGGGPSLGLPCCNQSSHSSSPGVSAEFPRRQSHAPRRAYSVSNSPCTNEMISYSMEHYAEKL